MMRSERNWRLRQRNKVGSQHNIKLPLYVAGFATYASSTYSGCFLEFGFLDEPSRICFLISFDCLLPKCLVLLWLIYETLYCCFALSFRWGTNCTLPESGRTFRKSALRIFPKQSSRRLSPKTSRLHGAVERSQELHDRRLKQKQASRLSLP